MKCISLLKASCYEIHIASDGSWNQSHTGALSKVQYYDTVTSTLPYKNIEHARQIRVTGSAISTACATINLALFDPSSGGSTSRTIFVEGDDATSLAHLGHLTQWSECARHYLVCRHNDGLIARIHSRTPHLRLIILTRTVTLISGMNSKALISLHRYIVVERDPIYSEVPCRSRKIGELCAKLDQSFAFGTLLMIRDKGTGFLNRIGTSLEQFDEEVGPEKAASLHRRIKALATSISRGPRQS